MSETHARNAGIDAALNETKELYLARDTLSLTRYLEAITVMPGGDTRTVPYYAPFPLTMARAKGCRVWDADGHDYIDFTGDDPAGPYGYSHPVIRKAIDTALDNGIGLGASGMTEARLAGVLCERFGLQRVRFTNSGAEANLLAVSLGRIVTRRKKVMVFNGACHGALLDFTNGGSPVNVPFETVVAPYNDIERTRALVTDDLALVIVEPMIAGGCILASVAFLDMLRRETTRTGALLILDEVMTSRLAPSGVRSITALRPDLTTLGHHIGGGLSLGALGGRHGIMDRLDPRRADAPPYASTFNDTALAMAAVLAGLTKVYTPEAATALNARGDALRARLNALCHAANAPLQFTGIGSMLAVHAMRGPVTSPEIASKGDAKLKELFFFDMLAHGIWMARCGTMALSVPIGDAECDALAAAVADFLAVRKSLLK